MDSRSDIISKTLICPCLPGSVVAQIVVLLSKKAVLESERVIKEENTRAQQPVVFVSSPNGDPAIDAAVNIFAHELAETATDPLLNAWWADSDGDENADKCSFNFGEGFLFWTTAVLKHPDLISVSIQECPSVSTSDEIARMLSSRGCLWSFILSLKGKPNRSSSKDAPSVSHCAIRRYLSGCMDTKVWGSGGRGVNTWAALPEDSWCQASTGLPRKGY